ncbi:MAG TPA: wax ester/triacylglycerol synthase family O-acyltransferase [Mycobacterium sp.]|nr:wax ester/triacylglycerol synthase family O-acyltransferase [Mycobacterium sp.]
MQRLTGLDAFFLYLETPTQPLNVCCVLQLDTSTMPGGYTYPRFRAALAKRVKAVPEFRMKLADSQFNLDHPVWVDDEDFQLRRHLHRVGAPPPGGHRELAEVCGHIAGLPLNRDRPLWEMWVIEGGAGADSLAVLLKAHHAVVDGLSGVNLLANLSGTEPEMPPAQAADGAGGARPLQIAAGGLVAFALRPWRFATMLPPTVRTLVQTVFRARQGRTMAAPFAAPPTTFNAPFTEQRNIAFIQLDLGDIKTVKNRLGLTVNDVVVGLCAGALRRFLLDRGELPDAPLLAAVPVSVRDKSERPGRNQLTWMFCRLETHISDPSERLRSIVAGNAAAKDHSEALGPTLLHDWTQFGGQTMFGAAMRILPRIPVHLSPVYNLIMSNVPGPQAQMYFLGCAVNAMYPLGPILAGAGLNITVMSLDGKLGVGIISCPDVLPDLWGIAELFPAALDELLQCTDPSDAG